MKYATTALFATTLSLLGSCKLKQSTQNVSSIIGTDDRVVATDTALLAKIGTISVNGTKVCTGFLISGDIVATAYHCIPGTNRIIVSKLQFHPRNFNPVDVAYIANANEKTDIAFLKLRNPISAEPFRVREFIDRQAPFSIISYDKASNRLLLSQKCDVRQEKQNAYLTHNCDTLPGASGAPVLQNGTVVGMHMGSSRKEKLNIAVDAQTLKNGDLRPSGYFDRNDILPEGLLDAVISAMGEQALNILLEECRTGKNTNAVLCAAASAYKEANGGSLPTTSPNNQPQIPLPTQTSDNNTSSAIPKVCATLESDITPTPPTFHQTDNGGFSLATEGANSLWPTGSTLRIRFVNGTAAEQEKVMGLIRQWPVNLKFQLVSSGSAEIRIRVPGAGNDQPGRSNSQLGKNSLGVDQNQFTLTMGWWEDACVLHEFGHALGFIHEHQSPAVNIPWNKEVVYKDLLESNGWDRATVDHNVFEAHATTNYSQFDSKSVMIYDFPANWTTNGVAIVRPDGLSPTDKVFSAKLYPGSMTAGAGENENCGGFAGIGCNESFYRYGSDTNKIQLKCVMPQKTFDSFGVCRAQ